MRFTIFTLFPAWFDGPLGDSIVRRARERDLVSIDIVNFRDWTTDKHRSVDDAPYGGGAGMVLRPGPISAALDARAGAPGTPDRAHVIMTAPSGRRFDQRRAEELAHLPHVAIICGHYEGIDQRVLDTRVDEELSIGDFVLTGGEIPAMAIVDAVIRLVPGVLGNEQSAPSDSFSSGLLEGPQYTRPEVFEGHRVPDILLGGNHARIAAWREEQALARTRARRPDLLTPEQLNPPPPRHGRRRRTPPATE